LTDDAGEPEIWFKRDGPLHATPCHWKGWVAVLVGMAGMAPGILIMAWADRALTQPLEGPVAVAGFVSMVATFFFWWNWTGRHTA
jgi:hypothetical protein